jgi:hypothetical protein
MVCPDYCFEVFRFTTPIETEVDQGPSGPAPKAPGAGEVAS